LPLQLIADVEPSLLNLKKIVDGVCRVRLMPRRDRDGG
jgi:hypothetical protein